MCSAIIATLLNLCKLQELEVGRSSKRYFRKMARKILFSATKQDESEKMVLRFAQNKAFCCQCETYICIC